MAGIDRPLRYTNEIASAIILSGEPDFALAHGAGLLADEERYRIISPDPAEPRLRRVLGVCALSLDRDGQASFRTATFGLTRPDTINRIDAGVTNQVIELGVAGDKLPGITKLTNTPLVLRTIYDEMREGGACTIGGTFVVHNSERGAYVYRQFVSEKYARYFEEMGAKRYIRLARSIGSHLASRGRKPDQRKDTPVRHFGTEQRPVSYDMVGTLIKLASHAVRRPGGPIVIDRPLEAIL